MKKTILFITGFSIFFYIFTFSSVVPKTYSQQATSNCAVTDIGNVPPNQPLPAGCGSESAIVQNVIQLAKSRLHPWPYIWGAPSRDWATENPTSNPPKAFDCSGFVGWAWYWGSDGKVNMAGQTSADWSSNNPLYEKISTNIKAQLQPGDLVYFSWAQTGTPDHVGLFIGPDHCGDQYCFLEYSEPSNPGNENTLTGLFPYIVGIIRMKV